MSGKGWKCEGVWTHPRTFSQLESGKVRGARGQETGEERSKGRNRGISRGEGTKSSRAEVDPEPQERLSGCQGNTRWCWKNKVKRLNPAFKMEGNINTGICVPFWLGSGFKSSITALGYTANYKKKATEDIECHKNDICALQRAQIILTESSKVSNCSQRQNYPFVLVSRHTS